MLKASTDISCTRFQFTLKGDPMDERSVFTNTSTTDKYQLEQTGSLACQLVKGISAWLSV